MNLFIDIHKSLIKKNLTKLSRFIGDNVPPLFVLHRILNHAMRNEFDLKATKMLITQT